MATLAGAAGIAFVDEGQQRETLRLHLAPVGHEIVAGRNVAVRGNAQQGRAGRIAHEEIPGLDHQRVWIVDSERGHQASSSQAAVSPATLPPVTSPAARDGRRGPCRRGTPRWWRTRRRCTGCRDHAPSVDAGTRRHRRPELRNSTGCPSTCSAERNFAEQEPLPPPNSVLPATLRLPCKFGSRVSPMRMNWPKPGRRGADANGDDAGRLAGHRGCPASRCCRIPGCVQDPWAARSPESAPMRARIGPITAPSALSAGPLRIGPCNTMMRLRCCMLPRRSLPESG